MLKKPSNHSNGRVAGPYEKKLLFQLYNLSKQVMKMDSNLPKILFWYNFFPELNKACALMFGTYSNAKPTERPL